MGSATLIALYVGLSWGDHSLVLKCMVVKTILFRRRRSGGGQFSRWNKSLKQVYVENNNYNTLVNKTQFEDGIFYPDVMICDPAPWNLTRSSAICLSIQFAHANMGLNQSYWKTRLHLILGISQFFIMVENDQPIHPLTVTHKFIYQPSKLTPWPLTKTSTTERWSSCLPITLCLSIYLNHWSSCHIVSRGIWGLKPMSKFIVIWWKQEGTKEECTFQQYFFLFD